jgi:predicted Holliday junction resolvase-like endonuclease
MLALAICLGAAVTAGLLVALGIVLFRYGRYKESHPYTQKALDQAREQTSKLSAATRLGRTVEHLAPFAPEFGFNPRDARFFGDPIDYIVFDGLDEGVLRGIWFVEVKSGAKRLNPRQRQVRRTVDAGQVHFRTLHLTEDPERPVAVRRRTRTA